MIKLPYVRAIRKEVCNNVRAILERVDRVVVVFD